MAECQRSSARQRAESLGSYRSHTAAAGTAGLLSHYVLQVDVVETVPPAVVSVSLPAEGTVSPDVIDPFTVTFSKDMAPATVNDGANLDLRAGGADGQFGTADDRVYHVVSCGYTSGTNARYRVADGPLPPGAYRFTATAGLTDRAGAPLTPYVRAFTLTALTPYVLESSSNDSFATATPLGPAGIGFSGTFTAGPAVSALEPERGPALTLPKAVVLGVIEGLTEYLPAERRSPICRASCGIAKPST